MYDLFWFSRSRRCAVCGGVYAPIELTIRFGGKQNINKWVCASNHLKAWWDKEYVGEEVKTKVIVVKK